MLLPYIVRWHRRIDCYHLRMRIRAVYQLEGADIARRSNVILRKASTASNERNRFTSANKRQADGYSVVESGCPVSTLKWGVE